MHVLIKLLVRHVIKDSSVSPGGYNIIRAPTGSQRGQGTNSLKSWNFPTTMDAFELNFSFRNTCPMPLDPRLIANLSEAYQARLS